MKLNKIMLAGIFMATSGAAWAHGYVNSPESRAFMCSSDGKYKNTDCGDIMYEPQSLEAPDGFTQTAAADGHMGSVNVSSALSLDEQTATRWAKNTMKAGDNTFTWYFKAGHPAAGYKYFITKPGWNPNQKLDRASFEKTPFCDVAGSSLPEPQSETAVSMHCNVPERTGYQVIRAEWDVSNTSNSFFNLIDVNFDNSGSVDEEKPGDETPADVWQKSVGTISANTTLNVGDEVKLRVFSATDERQDMVTTLKIEKTSDGLQNVWPKLLADKVNAEQENLRAGQKDANGNINPVFDSNPVYAKDGSGLERVETQIIRDTADIPAVAVKVTGVNASYEIHDGKVTIPFTVETTGTLNVNAWGYDQDNVSKGYTNAIVDNASKAMSLDLKNVVAGQHQLVVVGKAKDGSSAQQTIGFMLTSKDAPATDAKYDYVFPENLKTYTEGTVVLQPKDGHTYKCKPFPYSGYCAQFSSNANHYEPGVGSHWQDAWTKQ